MIHSVYIHAIMLNPFPIQFLAPLAYLILRVVLALVCIRLGIRMVKNTEASGARKGLGLLFSGAGILLFFGLYTQIAALGVMALTTLGTIRTGTVREYSRTTLVLMGAVAVSLFITGAGPFAFDLPI
jgi:uncharacterized membrane protein YphA (DoxX/SURF4 family)